MFGLLSVIVTLVLIPQSIQSWSWHLYWYLSNVAPAPNENPDHVNLAPLYVILLTDTEPFEGASGAAGLSVVPVTNATGDAVP